MKSSELGKKGEAMARQRYEKAGYHVLEMNYRTRMGEIDLIAEKNQVYVFCEVKARSAGPYEPKEAVTPAKQRRIMLAAQHYVASRLGREVNMRFDVAEIIVQGDQMLFRCTENAFSF